MNLHRTALKNVAEFINGAAFKPSDWGEKGVRIIRIQNLTDPTKPFNRTAKNVDVKYHVQPGELLVSWSATLGVFTWSGPDIALLNQHIFRVIPNERVILKEYLRHMLAGAIIDMEKHLHGATMKHVNRSEFLSTTIPLPPIIEQKRIAEILDAAEALRGKRRASLTQLDSLLQSSFLDMFGDPVMNPMGWEEKAIEEISEVQGGLQLSAKRQKLPLKKPYLRVANVYRGRLWLGEIKEIGLTKQEVERTRLLKGDMLVVEGHGNPDEIGRCAIWDGSIDDCVHQNHLIRVRIDPLHTVPDFVASFLNSDGGSRRLKGQSRTTSGLNTISVTKVKKAKIPLPPLGRQLRFAAIVESVERQKGRYHAHLVELDTLFAALQQRAFVGEL